MTHNMVNNQTNMIMFSQISVTTNRDRKEAEMVMCGYRRVCRCVSEPDWGFRFSAAKKNLIISDMPTMCGDCCSGLTAVVKIFSSTALNVTRTDYLSQAYVNRVRLYNRVVSRTEAF